MATWLREHTTGAPVETIYVRASISGMPQHMVVDHVRVICTQLAPLLADHAPLAKA